MEEGRNAFKILKDKSIRKRLLGRPRRMWKDSIRRNLEQIAVNARSWLRIGIIGEASKKLPTENCNILCVKDGTKE